MSTLRHYRLSPWLLAGFVGAAPWLAADAVAQGVPATLEGLVKVPSKRLAAVYLLPGVDFRTYTKIMIDAAQVSFQKDWIKEMNRSRGVASRRIDEKDAEEIAGAMRSGFQDIFVAAFKAKGYEVVTTPAPDVLRLSPEVVNVYLNAPDPMRPGVARTYTVEAGEATLVLAARDSTTGALVGVAIDRSSTRGFRRPTFTTNASNRGEFEDLFRHWADVCVKGLEQLKEKAVPGPAAKR